MLWVVNANVIRNISSRVRVWQQSSQVPTFFLDGDIQGITGGEEHAKRVAKDVIDPFNLYECHIHCAPAEFQMNKGEKPGE
jgi:hypothetical protein